LAYEIIKIKTGSHLTALKILLEFYKVLTWIKLQ
jgi:hypothetical protein